MIGAEIVEACRELIRLSEAATPEPWCFGYSRIDSVPRLREYSAMESEIPMGASDEAYESLPEYEVAHVPAAYGDTPTEQGRQDAVFICHARAHGAAIARALLDIVGRQSSGEVPR